LRQRHKCQRLIHKATDTKEPLRLVGYEVDRFKYWIATNRIDLTAEQIAAAYKLRWGIENFFAWWKRHLKVYHLIARSEHGLMVQNSGRSDHLSVIGNLLPSRI
jgi:IS4 transposase